MTRPSARFLAQLAHDLRSPLNVIGSTLTELGHEPALSAAEQVQVIGLSTRAVNRLLALSDRLELAARLDAPFEPTLQTLDLVITTQQTLDQFLPAQLRRRIEVVTAFPQGQVLVQGDAKLLPRLLLELLTNANRFARRQLRIEVSGGESARVRIEDDGEGVKEDERALLFEPFAARRSHTGLGMGLWLAQRLAELHRGTVIVEPLATGTRAQLTLPVST